MKGRRVAGIVVLALVGAGLAYGAWVVWLLGWSTGPH